MEITFQRVAINAEEMRGIKKRAAANAQAIGLSASEWAEYSEAHGHKAHMMMAHDPEGERLRIERERKH